MSYTADMYMVNPISHFVTYIQVFKIKRRLDEKWWVRYTLHWVRPKCAKPHFEILKDGEIQTKNLRQPVTQAILFNWPPQYWVPDMTKVYTFVWYRLYDAKKHPWSILPHIWFFSKGDRKVHLHDWWIIAALNETANLTCVHPRRGVTD